MLNREVAGVVVEAIVGISETFGKRIPHGARELLIDAVIGAAAALMLLLLWIDYERNSNATSN